MDNQSTPPPIENPEEEIGKGKSILLISTLVLVMVLLVGTIGFATYLFFEKQSLQEQSDELVRKIEELNKRVDQELPTEEEPILDDEPMVGDGEIDSSCHPNCTLEDLYKALKAHTYFQNYKFDIFEGYGCNDKTALIGSDGDLQAVIINDGSSGCYTPSGFEARVVDNLNFTKLPGQAWKKGLASNESGGLYFDPEERTISAIVPENPFTSQMTKATMGGIERYYRDTLAMEDKTYPTNNVAYSYNVTRMSGVEECFGPNWSEVGLGECGSSNWYFNDKLQVVVYRGPALESTYEWVLVDYNENPAVEKPI